MEYIALTIRLVLFAIFTLAGIGKALDPPGAEKAMRDFGIPGWAVKPFVIFLPAIEMIIGVGLLFPETSWIASFGALLLLAVFSGAIGLQMLKGRSPDCHCFGQMHSEPAGASSLIRNLVFAALAIVLVTLGASNQGIPIGNDPVESLQSFILLALLIIAIVAFFHLREIIRNQHIILRRMDAAQLLSGEVSPAERQEAGNPTDGLPIGAPFPDFNLPDSAGRIVTFESLMAAAKPILFFFVSPECSPCKALFPEIVVWAKELAGKVEMIIVSRGTIEANRSHFGDVNGVRFLFQTERELMDLVFARWTPTAVFSDINGNVASHPAAGDIAIRKLIRRIKDEDLNREFLYFRDPDSIIREPKIGERVPEFSLKDLNGKVIGDTDLLGKRNLLIFLSLTCGHCADLIEDIRRWEVQQHNGNAGDIYDTISGADPGLIVFSDGDVDEHRKLGLRSPIILDSRYRTAVELGMHGTPSAVLVNESGVIVSETAIGAANIWALLGERKPFST